jgi:hypothetical protein
MPAMKFTFCLAVALAAAMIAPCTWAGDRHEYEPELDAYYKFSDRMRLFLLADTTKTESVDALKNEVGAHLDLTLKRDFRERLHLADWARAHNVWVRVGYRQLRTWDGQREDVSEQRGLLELTIRMGLADKFFVAQRLGFDQRDLSGETSQRYRYRLDLEREYTVMHTVLVPYARAEFFYDTRYSAWSRQRYQMGSEIDMGKHWRLEPYYAVDLDSQPQDVQTDRVGLILKFYW